MGRTTHRLCGDVRHWSDAEPLRVVDDDVRPSRRTPMETIEQLDIIVPTLGDLVKGTRPDQLDNPTPCAKFQVRDLLGHFMGNIDAVAGGLRGEPMPDEL